MITKNELEMAPEEFIKSVRRQQIKDFIFFIFIGIGMIACLGFILSKTLF